MNFSCSTAFQELGLILDIRYITLFMESDHAIKQAVAFFYEFLEMLFGSAEGLHSKSCLLWVGFIVSSTYRNSSLVLFEKTPGGKSFN